MSTAQNFQPKIVAFCCENSGFLAADLAGKQGLEYPEDVQIIKLPCSGKIDIIYLLKALEKGADGAVVLACQKENCKFLKGNIRAAQRINQTGKLLEEIGIEKERVAIHYIAANQGHKFAEIIQSIYSKLREIGPNPGKVRK